MHPCDRVLVFRTLQSWFGDPSIMEKIIGHLHARVASPGVLVHATGTAFRWMLSAVVLIRQGPGGTSQALVVLIGLLSQ